MSVRRLSIVAAAVAGAAVSIPPLAAAAAPGAPGAPSYFDLARKDCVGTARDDGSKVWFTVADGALSDTYWPTIDATNVHSLQYVVSDGRRFTDLQQRDMTYRVVPDRSTGMSCTIVARSRQHHYAIETTYIADPARDAVLMRMRFTGPAADRVYLRLDPLAGGSGGGGDQNAGPNTATIVPGSGAGASGPVPVASNPSTSSNATNRDYAVPTFEALTASTGFDAASAGYAGSASDGLTTLDSTHALTPAYSAAPDGHVALTAELPRSAAGGAPTTLALGFGTTQAAAVQTAGDAAAQRFAPALNAYQAGWRAYDGRLRHATGLPDAARAEYRESINVVRASVDKTFPGAIAAGLGSPWGQSVPAGQFTAGKPTYFGSYREVFARDLYEAFSGLLAAGDRATARAATHFLFERQQQPDGSMPRNSLLNGEVAPDTGGLQLDETSYPILMDWEAGLATDHDLYADHVVPAADFLVAHGPSDGVERWEEQSGYSPSTIAAEIAGLTAAAKIAQAQGDGAHATLYQATADDFARHVKDWTVTGSGPYAPSYFLRLSKTGDPNAAISYSLGNGSTTADQRSVVDAGFLDLVRLGVLPASDRTVRASVSVIDSTIERSTPSGAGFYRYGTSAPGSEDGYGDCWLPDATSCPVNGAPWPPTDSGSGHLWPVLAGERGEYEIAAGRPGARSRLGAMLRMSSGQGLEPEQAWEDAPLPASRYGTDPTTASIGFAPGHPAGSASPLTWAQAGYARLALDASAGRDLDTPSITARRYVALGMPGALPLTLDPVAPTGGAVTVSGTTAPGAAVSAEASGSQGGAASVAQTRADARSGRFTLQLPVALGQTTVTVGSTLGHASGYAQTSVDDATLPGSTVLSAADPSGDDDGPGTYAYPTASDFSPGAFDLLGFTVSQTDSDVYLQAHVRSLASTFGSDFGAQLLDVYVHDPAAGQTSTAPAFPQRNYAIAGADAWSERIEAQGFAPTTWVDAGGSSRGAARLIVDQASNTATIVLPRATFGTVGPGWSFTVALTGQEGSAPDQARSFTATPGPYTFGVCATGQSSPICSVDPGTVPKVIDTIVPAGGSQATELDPTRGPVVLSGVPVPAGGS